MSERWQSIETAPRDGRTVILCWAINADGCAIDWTKSINTAGVFVQVASWSEEIGEWAIYADMISDPILHFRPTHWMPLPLPPCKSRETPNHQAARYPRGNQSMSDRTLMDCAQSALMHSEEDARIIADAAEEIERLRAERNALKSSAREFLTTTGAAIKSGKFHMNGSADMCHFVRQAMQKLDVLAFDREEKRPVGLERLHEEFKP